MKLAHLLASAAMTCAASTSAHAVVIYDQSFDTANIRHSTNINEGATSSFTALAAAMITDFTFWGGYWSSGAEPTTQIFTLTVRERTGLTVGAVVGSSTLSYSTVDTGFDHNDNGASHILEFSATLDSPFAIGAGDYTVSLLSTRTGGDSFIWQRVNAADPTASGLRTPTPAEGSSLSTGLTNAFLIEDNSALSDVPLPPAGLALLAAIGGLAAVRRGKAAA